MNQNLVIRLFITVALSAFLYTGCATAKNTQGWIKEGTIEVNPGVIVQAGDAGQRNDDATISTAIKTKFYSDELLSASNINVDTNHGEVTLNGKARNQDHIDRALQLARSADGVKRVRSNLTVR